ncbi:MAG: 50S ribosomal protein L25 [Ignavibacteria bacterium]|jgi:large subunit ribosomal protein L25|nr:50S ribosomal protein L25 [Ignavibacteria bacterium]
MLQELTLKASKRKAGKQIAKKMRREGNVPGVVYSKDKEGVNIVVREQDIKPFVYTSMLKVVNLDIEGEQEKCLVKAVKFDPVTDRIIHFDLLRISDDRKVTVGIPVEFTGGQPIGVRKGGRLYQVFHRFKVTCLPKHLVSSIEIDISQLDIGQSIYLEDLKFEGLEYDVPADSMICSVTIPRVKAEDEGVEGEAAEEGAEETEEENTTE